MVTKQSPRPATVNHVASPQAKFVTLRREIAEALVERDEEIDLTLTGLLAQQHCLFVGPPGTAKSLVAESVRKAVVGARSLTIHCCKDTTRGAAFGPTKLSALKQDRTERNLEGGAADSHFLILEECFKSGPAVLDMFLMLMNERVYREGLVQSKAPLRFLLGVSNEWSPEGCETALAAFFDRFLIRKGVKPIRTADGIKRLVKLPVAGENSDRSHNPQLSVSLSLADIDAGHKEASALEFTPEAADNFMAIHKALTADGIVAGDRRLKFSVGACQAYAYLSGATEVASQHLEVLKDVLWVDPVEQPEKCARVVAQIANPIGMKLNDLRLQAEDAVAKSSPVEAVTKLQQIQKEVGKLPSDPRCDKAQKHVAQLIKTTMNAVIGVNE